VSVASQQAGVGELTREFDADFDSPTQLRYVAPLLASLPSPLGGGRSGPLRRGNARNLN